MSTMFVAVSKLGRRRLRRTVGRVSKSLSISRSMLAPFGMRPGGGRVHGHAGAAGALGAQAADHQVALGQRIDLAVGRAQRRQQQRAAAQALGVAERGHRDVDGLALAVARREDRADHHGGDVLGLGVGALGQLDAELLEQVGDRLAGRLDLRAVARAVAGRPRGRSRSAGSRARLRPDEVAQALRRQGRCGAQAQREEKRSEA